MPVNPLLAGLAAGFQAFGNRKLAENDQAKLAELKRYEEAAARNKAIFEASLKPQNPSTYPVTGDDGKVYERTTQNRINPDGTVSTDELGMALLNSETKPPQTRTFNNGDVSVTEQFDPETGAWNELATAPRWQPKGLLGGEGGGGRGESVSFEDYESWTPERRQAYDDYKGRAKRDDEAARDRRIANQQVSSRMTAFDKKDSYERKADYAAYGIDPKASNARSLLRKAVKAEVFGEWGIADGTEEREVDVIEGGPGNNPPARNQPGSSKANPIVAGPNTPEPPPGTWVKLPDGRVIQTR